MAPLPRLPLVGRARGALAIEHLEDRSLLSGMVGVSLGNFLPADAIVPGRVVDIAAFVGAPLHEPADQLEDAANQSEVIVYHQGRVMEIEVAPDGTIVETAISITPEELPEGVAASLVNRFPGAAIQHVKAVIEAGVLGYDVVLDWRRQGALEVKVGRDGIIAAVERADNGAAIPALETLAADGGDTRGPASAVAGRQADAALEGAVAVRAASFAPPKSAATAQAAVKYGGTVDAASAAVPRPLPLGVEPPAGLRGTRPPQAAQSAGTAPMQAPADASRDWTDLEVAVRLVAEAAATCALPSLTPRLAGLLTDAVQLNVPALDVQALDQALSEFLHEVEGLATAVVGNTRSETASRMMLAAAIFAGLELVRREAEKTDPAHRPRPTRPRQGCDLRDETPIP